MNTEKTIATHKIVAHADGNIYKFYCDLSGALVCTTKPYKADTPENELQLAWEQEAKQHFNFCHKCGKQVSNAMFNVDVLECVGSSIFAPQFLQNFASASKGAHSTHSKTSTLNIAFETCLPHL